MKCPVCDSEMKIRTEHEECFGYVLSEEYHECENCKNYKYSYTYGNYQIEVGYAMFWYTHNTSEDIVKAIYDEVNLIINFQKEKRKNG